MLPLRQGCLLATSRKKPSFILHYCSGSKYQIMRTIALAHISVLNDVFAWFIVPLNAVGRFQFIPPMYWTIENLKDSENKQ
jgi:hypothetical protein